MNNSAKNEQEAWDNYISSVLERCQDNTGAVKNNSEKPEVNTELEVLKAVKEATIPLLKEIIRLNKGSVVIKDDEDQEDQDDGTNEFLELMKGIGNTSDL